MDAGGGGADFGRNYLKLFRNRYMRWMSWLLGFSSLPQKSGSFLLISEENQAKIKVNRSSGLTAPPGVFRGKYGTSHPLLKDCKSMAKRRGNPNWGKPEPIGPVVPTVTSFEQIVKEFKLSPDQYIRSTRLREWARRNKNSKYIPEALLEAWGFEIESTL
jgi:hypothetical protein